MAQEQVFEQLEEGLKMPDLSLLDKKSRWLYTRCSKMRCGTCHPL